MPGSGLALHITLHASLWALVSSSIIVEKQHCDANDVKVNSQDEREDEVALLQLKHAKQRSRQSLLHRQDLMDGNDPASNIASLQEEGSQEIEAAQEAPGVPQEVGSGVDQPRSPVPASSLTQYGSELDDAVESASQESAKSSQWPMNPFGQFTPFKRNLPPGIRNIQSGMVSGWDKARDMAENQAKQMTQNIQNGVPVNFRLGDLGPWKMGKALRDISTGRVKQIEMPMIGKKLNLEDLHFLEDLVDCGALFVASIAWAVGSVEHMMTDISIQLTGASMLYRMLTKGVGEEDER